MSETLTPTIEDYLGLIYLLEREGQVVIGARLARRLGVSRPTVTATLQRMVRSGLVRMNERKEVSLTPSGQELAENLLRRHMLAEWLLRDLVGLPWHQVHEEADRLEHHFSEQAVERLGAIFQRESCPHGNPMPGTEIARSIPLLEAGEGEEVVIVRISEEAEEKRELMAFLEENGLLPGTHLRISSLRPYNETVTVEVAGRPVVLGWAVARFIQVRREGDVPG